MQVAQQLDLLAETIKGLRKLEADVTSNIGAAEPLRGHYDHQADPLDEALGSFGFSRENPPYSLETLKQEWLNRTDDLRPDRYMTAPHEECTNEYLRLMTRFEFLVSYYGWTRSAEA
jgi:hypothetical protein